MKKKPVTTPRPTAATGPLGKDDEQYVAVDDYVAGEADGLSFRRGDVLRVREKNDIGWWFAISTGGVEGWVPSTYLEAATPFGATASETTATAIAAAATKPSPLPAAREKAAVAASAAVSNTRVALKPVPSPAIAKPPSDVASKAALQPAVARRPSMTPSNATKPMVTSVKPTVTAVKPPVAAAQPKPRPVVAATESKPKPAIAVAKPKLKPVIAAAQPKPKPSIAVAQPKPQSVVAAVQPMSKPAITVAFPKPVSVNPQPAVVLATPTAAKPSVAMPKPSAAKHKAPDEDQIQPVANRKQPARVADSTPKLSSDNGAVQRTGVAAEARRNGGGKSGSCDQYVAVDAYTSPDEDGLSFRKGSSMEVLEKDTNGWWFVRQGKAEGWVPSTFLKKRPQQDGRAPGAVKPPLIQAVPAAAIGQPAGPSPLQGLAAILRSSGDGRQAPGGVKPPVAQQRPTQSTAPQRIGVSTNTDSGGSADRYVAVDAYTSPDKDGLSFRKGSRMEVLEKDANGWWFVRQGKAEGWVPSTFLKILQAKSTSTAGKAAVSRPPRPASASQARSGVAAGKTFVAIDPYDSPDVGGLSFRKGDRLRVIEETADGWWFATRGKDEGWVPSSFLQAA